MIKVFISQFWLFLTILRLRDINSQLWIISQNSRIYKLAIARYKVKNNRVKTRNSAFFCKCKFVSHNSAFFLAFQSLYLAILTFFLRIVRYKLTIASYKVQFGGGKKTDIFSELQVYISQFLRNNIGIVC